MKNSIKFIRFGAFIQLSLVLALVVFSPFAGCRANNRETEQNFTSDSGDYCLSVELLEISDAEKKAYCKMTEQERKGY